MFDAEFNGDPITHFVELMRWGETKQASTFVMIEWHICHKISCLAYFRSLKVIVEILLFIGIKSVFG